MQFNSTCAHVYNDGYNNNINKPHCQYCTHTKKVYENKFYYLNITNDQVKSPLWAYGHYFGFNH